MQAWIEEGHKLSPPLRILIHCGTEVLEDARWVGFKCRL
jgi:hypothetical protein